MASRASSDDSLRCDSVDQPFGLHAGQRLAAVVGGGFGVDEDAADLGVVSAEVAFEAR